MSEKYSTRISATLKKFANKFKLKVKVYRHRNQLSSKSTYTYSLIRDYEGNYQMAIADIREVIGWFGDKTYILDRLYLEGSRADAILWGWESDLKEFKTLPDLVRYLENDKYFIQRAKKK